VKLRLLGEPRTRHVTAADIYCTCCDRGGQIGSMFLTVTAPSGRDCHG
jgi:hypothetical protein